MAGKRHLPMLAQGSSTDEPPPSRVYFVVVSAAATLLSWLLVAAALNGLLGPWLARAGDLAATIANLAGLTLAAGVGGAAAASLDASAPLSRARVAGVIASFVGWIGSFGLMSAHGQSGSFGAWLVVLLVMAVAGAFGSDVGFRVLRSRGKTPSTGSAATRP